MTPLLRILPLLPALLTLAFGATSTLEAGEITSIADFRELSRDEIIAAKQPIAVRFQATIVYADPQWNVTFVTSDGSGLFVHTNAETDYGELARGAVAEIEGHAIGGQLGAAVYASKISPTGKSVELAPKKIGSIPEDVLPLDSQFVQLEADVVSVLDHSGHTLIHAHGDGTHFRIAVPHGLRHHTVEGLVGARILASGSVGISVLDSSHPTFSLFSQSESDLTILTPPPLGAEPAKAYSVNDLLPGSGKSIQPGDQIMVSGIAVRVEDLTTLWVGKPEQAIAAHCGHGTYGLKDGDRVILSGIYTLQDGHPSIRSITVASNGNVPQLVPKLYSANAFISSPPNTGALVKMNAALYSAVPSKDGSGTILELMDGSARVTAHLPVPPSKLEDHDLATASEVTVTGICKLPSKGSPPYPYLLLNSPEDIVVTNRVTSSLSLSQILWPLSAIILTIALASAWTASLRGQVAARTAELHQKTDRLARSESQLATTTARLRAVHNSVREAILVTSPSGAVLDANVHFKKFFALPFSPHSLSGDELSHQLSSTVADPHSFSDFWQSLVADPAAERQQHITAIQPDGTPRELETFTAPVFLNDGGELTGRVWVFRDITDQLALEERLVHAKKMEAVGRLSAGIAHDFNNLLTGISGSIAISRLRPDRKISELDQHLDTAASAAHRAKELVHRLLGFSRQSNLDLTPACANEVVSASVATVLPSLPSSISLETVLSPSLWQTRIDSAHLVQVIHDLCANARDALPAGGTITMSTRNTRRSRAPRTSREACVEINVTDDGIGIPSDHLKQVFEPFFTTKEQGKGTGLGLAMSFGVVEQHGGWMTCRSVEGQGTSISIFLPRHHDEKVPSRPSPAAAPPARAKKKPTSKLAPGHVLIIDDEPVVRSVSEGIFRHHKFEVSTANNGREGLDWLAANPGEAHIVILDLTMPVLSGKETLREIRSLYPGLPVVIASGYLIDLDAFAEEVGSHPDAFVQKPFEVEHILNVVRGILSGDTNRAKHPQRA